MNVEEIRKKVRSLCEDAGLQFFFAVPNASEWGVTDCEHLRKIVSYHKELETLPPVTPTRKKGKWTNGNPICPCCGEDKFKDLDADIWADWQPKYCPNCGSLMEVKNDDIGSSN